MGLQRSELNEVISEHVAHEVQITVYTDPLCCWSWAFQPALDELKKNLGSRAAWELKMGGLISSWDNFHDEINSVSRPAQMGPVWMHAGQIANVPINHQVWLKDPPASSYPACVAVKSAQLQAQEYGDAYLQLLREACMIKGANIARQPVLFDIAEKFAAGVPDFDLQRFKDDYQGGSGVEAFRGDMAQVRLYNITRFPTLLLRSKNGKAILIPGYRHYQEIEKAIEMLVPAIEMQ